MAELTLNLTLTTDYNTLNGLWVFSVTDPSTGEMLYYGCERLKTIPTLRELKRHSMGKVPEQLTISLLTPVPTPEAGAEYIAALKLIEPARYADAPQPSRPVRCDQTGIEYKNAHQAAKSNNINPSYLYMHLLHVDSYKTCKGLTFSYIEA